MRLKTIHTFTTTINPSSKPTRASLLTPRTPADELYPGDFVEVGIWSAVEIDIGVVCTCLPSIRILVVRYAPRCMGMGSSADEGSDPPSRPSAQGGHRRLRKRSYVNFDVEGGGGSGRSGKSTLTAVASTPGGSTLMDSSGKKSPWSQSEFRLATFKRQSTEMVDDVMVASDKV